MRLDISRNHVQGLKVAIAVENLITTPAKMSDEVHAPFAREDCKATIADVVPAGLTDIMHIIIHFLPV